MKINKCFSVDQDTFNKFVETADILSTSQAKLLDAVILHGIQEIKEANYNFTEFIKKIK